MQWSRMSTDDCLPANAEASSRFLTSRFDPRRSGAEAAEILLGSAVAPSRQLLQVAAEEVQKRELFTLLDEQRDAFEIVMHAVNSARRADRKTAVVIAGGPGSGKSVIALSVLGELARQGRTVLHATGSKSFTQTLRRVAGNRAPAVRNLFKYFNSFPMQNPTISSASSLTKRIAFALPQSIATPHVSYVKEHDRKSKNYVPQRECQFFYWMITKLCVPASKEPSTILRASRRAGSSTWCRLTSKINFDAVVLNGISIGCSGCLD